MSDWSLRPMVLSIFSSIGIFRKNGVGLGFWGSGSSVVKVLDF